MLVEEFVLPLVHGVEQLNVLGGAVHHGAAVGRDQTVRKVEAALNGTFQQGAAGLAQQSRHVIGGDVHGTGMRRKQADRKCVPQVQQGLRYVFAGKGDAYLALAPGLRDERVVGLLEKVFKVQQML